MTSNSLKEQVFARIREDIVNLRLPPGEPLNERELSERFRISKTPIREAIQLLNNEGWVQIVPFKGAFVTPISLSDIREIFQIREGIEPIAAGYAALNPDIERLSLFEDEFNRYTEMPPAEYTGQQELGMRFHMYLIEYTKNQRLLKLISNLNVQMNRIRAFFRVNLNSTYLQGTLEEHKAILKAVKEGRSEEAEKHMRQHIRNFFEILKELI